MGAEDLEYEPTDRARPVVSESGPGITRILVAMPGNYVPIPKWAYQLDLFSLVVIPIWLVTSCFLRVLLRTPKPPRAVFEVTENLLRISLRDRKSGDVTAFDVPRSAIAEVRANRYENGLWLDVPGHVKDTYLTNLPSETICRIEAALSSALGNDLAPAV